VASIAPARRNIACFPDACTRSRWPAQKSNDAASSPPGVRAYKRSKIEPLRLSAEATANGGDALAIWTQRYVKRIRKAVRLLHARLRERLSVMGHRWGQVRTPRKGMQSWRELLDDSQIEQLYLYVKARSEGRLAVGRPHRASGK
jgi:DNA-binding transcriptional MocR family regulator